MNQAPAYPHPHAPYPQAPPIAPAPVASTQPLARMPLQIGTSCTWNATAAAITLLPAIAITLAPIAYLGAPGALVSLGLGLTLTLPFIIYAVASLLRSRRSRASDVLLFPSGVRIEGGPMHRRELAWSELAAPGAYVECTTEKRFRLGWLLLGALMFLLFLAAVALMIAARTGDLDVLRLFGTPWKRKEITIWRLWLVTPRERLLAATTDREIEASSMQAAADSIQAVASGQRYVAQAPAHPAQVLACHGCGAPVIPDDVATVVCPYCRTQVPIPPYFRQQAAATRAAEASRGTTQSIVGKLVSQPGAGTVNARIAIFVVFMFLVWPIAWGVVAPHAIADGFDGLDMVMLLAPVTAVLGWAFLSRALLADRGALQLLTLGFGALAPKRPGDPPLCRRCQGPLPATNVGGAVACRYCGSDNVVGVDLRPLVGPARAQEATLDKALAERKSEKVKWGILSAVAVCGVLGWLTATVLYLVFNVVDAFPTDPTPPPAPTPSAVAPRPAPPSMPTPKPTASATPSATSPAKRAPPPRPPHK